LGCSEQPYLVGDLATRCTIMYGRIFYNFYFSGHTHVCVASQEEWRQRHSRDANPGSDIWIIVCADRTFVRYIGLSFIHFEPFPHSWYGWSAQAKLHWIMPIIGSVIFGFGMMATLYAFISHACGISF
jgi:hypothetical protein